MRLKLLVVFFLFINIWFARAVEVNVLTEDVPPLQIAEGEKLISGIAYEIVNEIFKHTDITPRYKVLSWARAYQRTLNEPNTFIFSMLRTDKRESDFIWIGKIFSFKSNITTLKSREDLHSIEDLEPLLNFSVGAYMGDYSEDYLKGKGFSESQNLYLSEHQTVLWKMLFSGRLDAVFTNSVAFNQGVLSAGFNPEDTVKLFEFDDINTDLFLATNLQTDPAIVAKVTKGLKTIKENGKFDEIIKRWEDKLNVSLYKK